MRIDTSKIDFSRVCKIYYGRDRYCRCGCAGKYFYKGDPAWGNLVKDIKKLGVVESDIEDCDDVFLNLPIGNDTAYTVYFKD